MSSNTLLIEHASPTPFRWIGLLEPQLKILSYFIHPTLLLHMVPLPLRWVGLLSSHSIPQHSTSHRIVKFSSTSQDEHQIIGYTLHSYTYGMGVRDGCSRLCCLFVCPFIHVSICAMQSVCVVWMGGCISTENESSALCRAFIGSYWGYSNR
jgi:hypothetical protein